MGRVETQKGKQRRESNKDKGKEKKKMNKKDNDILFFLFQFDVFLPPHPSCDHS